MGFEQVTAEELKQKLKEEGIKGLALDIDDVLCLTDNHWIHHMTEAFGAPDGLTHEEIRDRYHGVFDDIPLWRTEKAVARIDELIHSNAFQETIPVIESAQEAVKKISELIPIVAYITARPISIYEGTVRWLEHHNFPHAPLIFRPLDVHHKKKNMWKANLLNSLYPEVVGIVDDHPALPEQLKTVAYEGTLYLYDSGNNHKDYKGLHCCRGWDEVYEAVKKDVRP